MMCCWEQLGYFRTAGVGRTTVLLQHWWSSFSERESSCLACACRMLNNTLARPHRRSAAMTLSLLSSGGEWRWPSLLVFSVLIWAFTLLLQGKSPNDHGKFDLCDAIFFYLPSVKCLPWASRFSSLGVKSPKALTVEQWAISVFILSARRIGSKYCSLVEPATRTSKCHISSRSNVNRVAFYWHLVY